MAWTSVVKMGLDIPIQRGWCAIKEWNWADLGWISSPYQGMGGGISILGETDESYEKHELTHVGKTCFHNVCPMLVFSKLPRCRCVPLIGAFTPCQFCQFVLSRLCLFVVNSVSTVSSCGKSRAEIYDFRRGFLAGQRKKCAAPLCQRCFLQSHGYLTHLNTESPVFRM